MSETGWSPPRYHIILLILRRLVTAPSESPEDRFPSAPPARRTLAARVSGFALLRLCGAVDPYDGNGRHDGKRSHAARRDTPRGPANSIPANAAMTKRIDLFLQYLPCCLNSRPARPLGAMRRVKRALGLDSCCRVYARATHHRPRFRAVYSEGPLRLGRVYPPSRRSRANAR